MKERKKEEEKKEKEVKILFVQFCFKVMLMAQSQYPDPSQILRKKLTASDFKGDFGRQMRGDK